MVMLTITNVKRSSHFRPSSYVGTVSRFSWIRFCQKIGPFDICSCQFALHYSWSTEARARRALANVSALLRPGGIFIGTMPDANVIVKKLREVDGLEFGNSVYWIQFDEEYKLKRFKSSSLFGIKYKFHLEDVV